MDFRDRIKELRRVKASELRPNPRNWREHPLEQQEAVRAVLTEVGFADAILARELPDGSLETIDGHLRAGLSEDQLVPVLILDVNESESDLILATLDPLAQMAEANAKAQTALLGRIDAEDAAIRKLLAELAADADVGDEDDKRSKAEAAAGVEDLALRPHEHYDYVIVLARTTHEWNRLVELLDIGPKKTEHGRIGVGRGLLASKLIELLEAAKPDGD